VSREADLDFLRALVPDRFPPSVRYADEPRRICGENLDAFIAHADEGEAWLIEGILPAGGVSVSAGEPRSFKTIGAVQLAFAVAGNEADWLGNPVNVHGPVVYLAEEGARGHLASLFDQFRTLTPVAEDAITIYYMQGLSPTRTDGWSQFVEQIRELHPVLLIIDTLARTMEGDENDAGAARDYLNPLSQLAAELDLTILVIHHFSKAGQGRVGTRMRGSGAFYGACEATLGFIRSAEDGRGGAGGRIEVESKYGEERTIWFTFAPPFGLIPADNPTPQRPRLSVDSVVATFARLEAEIGAVAFREVRPYFPEATESALHERIGDAVRAGRLTVENPGRRNCRYRCAQAPVLFEPMEDDAA
jgi:KaiC/GvpD/RAD55 family RecA-like ATPase